MPAIKTAAELEPSITFHYHYEDNAQRKVKQNHPAHKAILEPGHILQLREFVEQFALPVFQFVHSPGSIHYHRHLHHLEHVQLFASDGEETHSSVDFRGLNRAYSFHIQNQKQQEGQHKAQPGPFSEEVRSYEEIGQQKQHQSDQHYQQLVLDYVKPADFIGCETGRR